MLTTEITCNGKCTQHKVKYPNIMNVEIDQPPKKKECIIENHKKYELNTSTSLEKMKEANDMEIGNGTDKLRQTNESFHETRCPMNIEAHEKTLKHSLLMKILTIKNGQKRI